jgi:hypothetical protein
MSRGSLSSFSESVSICFKQSPFCRTGPLSRREQTARLDFRQKLVTIAEVARTRPCGLAHSGAYHLAWHHHCTDSENEQQPGRRKRPFGSGPVQLRFFHESPMDSGVPAGVPCVPDDVPQRTRSYTSQPAVILDNPVEDLCSLVFTLLRSDLSYPRTAFTAVWSRSSLFLHWRPSAPRLRSAPSLPP